MDIKKVLKYTGKTIAVLIAFCLLYLVAAFGLARIGIDEEEDASDEIPIYIKTNGVHTDIVVPTKNEQFDWSREVKFTDIQSKHTFYEHLAIGWGDKGFYLETPTWAELKPSIAFKAATGLNSTAIHATYYKEMKEDSTCKKIEISKNQYARLIEYITQSLQQNKDGGWINIATNANYGDTDAFYEAKGSYSIFHICNTWANNALKFSGQKHCLWTPFDTGIFLLYE